MFEWSGIATVVLHCPNAGAGANVQSSLRLLGDGGQEQLSVLYQREDVVSSPQSAFRSWWKGGSVGSLTLCPVDRPAAHRWGP